MIEINNLSKVYKDVIAVDNVSLKIDDGEIFGLLGVNGAGKTTIIKMLSTLVKPTSGEAFINGRSILCEKEAVKEIIDISTQETSIARNLTVMENFKFYCDIKNVRKEEAKKRIDNIIEKFNLNKVINKRAGKLSGGYQRKLSIALALLSEPQVLFLDEPTLGLDVLARRELWEVIESLKKKMTIILTTHYLEEAEALSDRIAILKDGRLLKIGTSKELIKETKSKNFEDAFIKIVKGGIKNEE